MGQSIQIVNDIAFSPKMIALQLERIYLDGHFTESHILRRFLSFIVNETMMGRANCLKEYTIALSVLEKPPNFRPKDNGIVRIHAGRLRRALQQYYCGKGMEDQIVITIPKGQYVPVFTDRKDITFGEEIAERSLNPTWPIDNTGKLTLAVLPFFGFGVEESQKSFGDHLCLLLSCSLMRLDRITIVAYQAVRNATTENPDYRELSASFGLTHILTGGAQRHHNIVRVCMQILECHTFRQLWSETVEYGISRFDVFDVQDAICECAAKGVSQLERKVSHETKTVPMLSAI